MTEREGSIEEGRSPERRLILIAWQTGEPLEVDYEPADQWDQWEVVAALRAALDVVQADDEEEVEQ